MAGVAVNGGEKKKERIGPKSTRHSLLHHHFLSQRGNMLCPALYLWCGSSLLVLRMIHNNKLGLTLADVEQLIVLVCFEHVKPDLS